MTFNLNGVPDWDSKFEDAEKYLASVDTEKRAYIRANEHAWIESLSEASQAKELERYRLVEILKPYWEIRGNVLKTFTPIQRKQLNDFHEKRVRMATIEGDIEWGQRELQRDRSLAYLVQRAEGQISTQKERMRSGNQQLDNAVSVWYLRFSDLTS